MAILILGGLVTSTTLQPFGLAHSLFCATANSRDAAGVKGSGTPLRDSHPNLDDIRQLESHASSICDSCNQPHLAFSWYRSRPHVTPVTSAWGLRQPQSVCHFEPPATAATAIRFPWRSSSTGNTSRSKPDWREDLIPASPNCSGHTRFGLPSWSGHGWNS